MPIQNLRLFTLLQKIKMLFNRLFPHKTASEKAKINTY